MMYSVIKETSLSKEATKELIRYHCWLGWQMEIENNRTILRDPKSSLYLEFLPEN